MIQDDYLLDGERQPKIAEHARIDIGPRPTPEAVDAAFEEMRERVRQIRKEQPDTQQLVMAGHEIAPEYLNMEGLLGIADDSNKEFCELRDVHDLEDRPPFVLAFSNDMHGDCYLVPSMYETHALMREVFPHILRTKQAVRFVVIVEAHVLKQEVDEPMPDKPLEEHPQAIEVVMAVGYDAPVDRFVLVAYTIDRSGSKVRYIENPELSVDTATPEGKAKEVNMNVAIKMIEAVRANALDLGLIS